MDILDRVRELSATCGYHGSKDILDGAAAEIERLRAALIEVVESLQELAGEQGCPGGFDRIKWLRERLAHFESGCEAYDLGLKAMRADNDRLRAGLDAAIRAAELALFVINKQGVMPNSSWESGFKKDMETATAARGDEQSSNEGEG